MYIVWLCVSFLFTELHSYNCAATLSTSGINSMSPLSCFLSLKPLIYLRISALSFVALPLRPSSHSMIRTILPGTRPPWWRPPAWMWTYFLLSDSSDDLLPTHWGNTCHPFLDLSDCLPVLCYISPAIKIPRSSSPVIPKMYRVIREMFKSIDC